MNPKAVEQALARLETAEKAVAQLSKATSYKEAEAAWTDVLLAASSIYSKLEQGSKLNGASAGWFGRMKKVRKDDHLLSYIHHARNSDEHGIVDVTSRHRDYRLPLTSPVVSITVPEGNRIWGLEAISSDGTRTPIAASEHEIIRLTTVRDDRYGDQFEPPLSHLGVALPAMITPLSVADLAIDYLRRLIKDAETLYG